ncbi:MAG: hypothetical protein OEM77_03520 [Nitrosopumilus sp.]|nr:hypothetical protein [Nitrosopumilus sp.]MDH3736123.1 hypothetical protein [Nitrosopumilus sp.]MDH3822544.1 hypothetical protein [Nitrosopumilus sp.]MDH3833282.1 hypothetical protein [Nitrosopumilus sp.]
MRHVELVAFENDSILHQKALSLPIGKVSLRQLGVLIVGILSVFAAYSITDNFWIAAIIFAMFLGIGMPNTKIMTPDQMIKSTIMFLIRGTSLSKKPEYMQKKKTNPKEQEVKTIDDNNIQNSEIQTNNNIISKVISQLESLYKNKSTENKSILKQDSNNDVIEKNHSIRIELTPENMLNITPAKTKSNTKNNSIDKLLNSLTTVKKDYSSDQIQSDFMQKCVTVLINGKKLESDKIIFKNNSMSVLLDESSKYDIQVIADK